MWQSTVPNKCVRRNQSNEGANVVAKTRHTDFSPKLAKSRQIFKNLAKSRQISPNLAKSRQISQNIAKYR